MFFNQPSSPAGAVRLVGADKLSIDLTAVPAAVERLSVAVTLDDSVTGSLATVTGLGVEVAYPAGTISSRASDLTSERAAVLLEIYCRNDSWKVRNVSAGWDDGLSVLVREHGVQVDDDGKLEPYLYAKSFARLPDIVVHEVDAWSSTYLHPTGTKGGIDYGRIGGVNDELPVMNEIIDSLVPGATMPTLVLFFTDGGFIQKQKIADLMKSASARPRSGSSSVGQGQLRCVRTARRDVRSSRRQCGLLRRRRHIEGDRRRTCTGACSASSPAG